RGGQRGLDLLAIADDDDREVIGIDVLARDANHILLRHGVYRSRELLVVVVRQALQVDGRDGAADSGDGAESFGKTLHERVLRRLQFLVGDRTIAANTAYLFDELDQGAIRFRRDDVSARAERPRSATEREARADAVAVALLLADVGIQSRLEELAEQRI